MLDPVAGAGAAVVARGPSAVFQAHLVQRVPPVLPQEVLVEASRQMVPGQDLVGGAVPAGVPVRVEPAGRHRLQPQAGVEVLGPLLEGAPGPPDPLDHRAQAAVPAAGQPLGQGRLRVVPLETDPPGPPQVMAQQADLAPQLHGRVLAEPLERRERLGHEPADRHRHRRRAPVGRPQLDAVAGQLGDAERVLVGLGGQAGEEVELHPAPPLRERRLDRAVEVLLADELVDDLAHPPRARLGGEGEAGAAGPLDLGGQAHGEGVDPQAGEGHRHLAAPGVADGVGHHLLDPAEVGRAQRREGHLVVAGAAQAVAHHGAHLLGRALPYRAGDHAGLAEPAAPGAAPEHLDVEAVVDHLGEGDELVLGIRPRGQVGDGPLLHPLRDVGEPGLDRDDARAVVGHVVEGGHVHPGHAGQLPQHAFPAAGGLARGLPPPEHLGDLPHRLLPVAQHHEVEVVGQRLGVVGAVAPGTHQRGVVGPIGRPHRHPGQIDAVEHVGVGELGREVEGDHVEVRSRAVALQREQREPLGPHERLEVDPGRVRALGQGVGPLVEDLIEDLQALVGQADLVGVGVGEQPRHRPGPVERGLHPVLAADVAGRFRHSGQQLLQPGPQVGHGIKATGAAPEPCGAPWSCGAADDCPPLRSLLARGPRPGSQAPTGASRRRRSGGGGRRPPAPGRSAR